ncbi:MAG TPA: IPExxxVDY family protein [Flavobacterium sp.]|nr:IPExxxVDY family protein [Flavobacterium sp.]
MTLQKKNTPEIHYKLDHDDDYDDILLIAIKSNMPDYKMAYHLNKTLNVHFQKLPQEISLTTENGINYFRNFKFKDHKNHLTWRLIENKSNYSISNLEKSGFLFNGESDLFSSTEYLISEWKNIDFFLLIEPIDDFFESNEILKKLESINNISTQFIVDMESLSNKSQKNLLF